MKSSPPWQYRSKGKHKDNEVGGPAGKGKGIEKATGKGYSNAGRVILPKAKPIPKEPKSAPSTKVLLRSLDKELAELDTSLFTNATMESVSTGVKAAREILATVFLSLGY